MVFVLLLFCIFIVPANVSAESSISFQIKDNVITEINGLSDGCDIIFPEGTTSVNVILKDVQINSISSEAPLGEALITTENCDINSVNLTGNNVTVSVFGGSLHHCMLNSTDDLGFVSVIDVTDDHVGDITLDADSATIVSSSKRLTSVEFGDSVYSAAVYGVETLIENLKIGSEVGDITFERVSKIADIVNNSDYVFVLDGKIYSYLETDDYDCSGADVTKPTVICVYYPMDGDSNLNFYEECDMIAANLFTGYYFEDGVVTIPEGIRIIDSCAFSELQTETALLLPESLQYVDKAVASGSAVSINFNQSSRVYCHPAVFYGMRSDEVVIPSNVQFIYYNQNDEELRNNVVKASNGIDNLVWESEEKNPDVEEPEQPTKVEEPIKLTKVKGLTIVPTKTGFKISWRKVKGTDHYVVKWSKKKNFKSSKTQKRFTTALGVSVKSGKWFCKVRAINGKQKGDWSKVVSVKV